jgi:O-antigen ligase
MARPNKPIQHAPVSALPPRAEQWAERLRITVLALLGATLAGTILFFWVQTHDQFELPKQMVLRAATALMLACWLGRLALLKRWEWRRSSLDIPVLIWAAWQLFKCLPGQTPSTSISWRGEYENFNGGLAQLNYAVLFFIATQHLRRWSEVSRLQLGFLALAGATAIYGLMQSVGTDFIRWSAGSVITDRFFSSLGNPNFLGALLIMALPLAATTLASRQHLRSPRGLWAFWASQAAAFVFWLGLSCSFNNGLHGFWEQASRPHVASAWAFNLASLLLVLAGLILAPLLLARRRWAAARALLLGAVALACFKALLNTGTRGAFLGLLAALATLLVLALQGGWMGARQNWLKRAALAVPLALLLTAGLSFMLGNAMAQRMAASFANPAAAFEQSRLEIWRPALKMAQDHFWTGTGLDTFKTMFPSYSTSRFADFDGANVSSRNAHCEPLQVLATTGLIGLLAWLALLGAWAWAWLKRYRAEKDGEVRLLLAGLLLLVVAYLTQNLVSFGVTALCVPYWLFMAALFTPGEPVGVSRSQAAPAALRALALAGSLACLLVLLPLSARAFRADLSYNLGSQLTTESAELAQANLEVCRGTAQLCLESLHASLQGMDPALAAKVGEAASQVQEAENALSNPSFPPAQLAAGYRYISQNLMLLWSAAALDEARRICPGEVKYHVYFGLACEELLKQAQSAEDSALWFNKAETAYQQGVALNPHNGYYHGNLGRLYAMQVAKGNLQYVQASTSAYLKAIELAPVTPLFYENLMQVYVMAGHGMDAVRVAENIQRSDTRFSGSLYAEAGTTLLLAYQQALAEHHKLDAMKDFPALSESALDSAERMRPDLFKAAYSHAVALLTLRRPREARAALERALALEPGNRMALDLKAAQHW